MSQRLSAFLYRRGPEMVHDQVEGWTAASVDREQSVVVVMEHSTTHSAQGGILKTPLSPPISFVGTLRSPFGCCSLCARRHIRWACMPPPCHVVAAPGSYLLAVGSLSICRGTLQSSLSIHGTSFKRVILAGFFPSLFLFTIGLGVCSCRKGFSLEKLRLNQVVNSAGSLFCFFWQFFFVNEQ
ncbi:hypothetical protein GE09DRAFT_366887 [Coniochaeta sp. 2T2.1]|nr:hypothetical protein GE09DRAFT_366887 [Coniochaeta sp. 2T2.1]